jgi:hypothetical protein
MLSKEITCSGKRNQMEEPPDQSTHQRKGLQGEAPQERSDRGVIIPFARHSCRSGDTWNTIERSLTGLSGYLPPLEEEAQQQALAQMRTVASLYTHSLHRVSAVCQSTEGFARYCRLQVQLTYACELAQTVLSRLSSLQTSNQQPRQVAHLHEEAAYFLTLLCFHHHALAPLFQAFQRECSL